MGLSGYKQYSTEYILPNTVQLQNHTQSRLCRAEVTGRTNFLFGNSGHWPCLLSSLNFEDWAVSLDSALGTPYLNLLSSSKYCIPYMPPVCPSNPLLSCIFRHAAFPPLSSPGPRALTAVNASIPAEMSSLALPSLAPTPQGQGSQPFTVLARPQMPGCKCSRSLPVTI